VPNICNHARKKCTVTFLVIIFLKHHNPAILMQVFQRQSNFPAFYFLCVFLYFFEWYIQFICFLNKMHNISKNKYIKSSSNLSCNSICLTKSKFCQFFSCFTNRIALPEQFTSHINKLHPKFHLLSKFFHFLGKQMYHFKRPLVYQF